MGHCIDQKIAFRDHHCFTKDDIHCPGADIVLMTEKDATKCMGFADQRHYFLKIDMDLPEEFSSYMIKQLVMVT
jgi:tetraacyldisaccharide 4'-kinase